nr:hypothetical protein [uncultured Methanospirillum sp.]
MTYVIKIAIVALILFFLSAGVSAFSISEITYTVGDDGNGIVDMQYQLNGTEKLQYDLITKALDMKKIGKMELEKALKREVVVDSITPESVHLTVYNIATVNQSEITTPSFTYVPVDSLVDPGLFWILQKFDINFIPHVSTVVFPDGYKESFTDAQTIPGITHTVSSS